MMTAKREITRADLIPLAEYESLRKQHRKELVEIKKNRRLEVGPVCTFYFENYQTMWSQVQEMLYIEKGGEAQIADELSAYNPLIPKGHELVATVMFEIDDELRRATLLSKLGGVEETAFIRVDGAQIMGAPEEDLDRTNAAGKASSVQFIHFTFTPEQIAKFKAPGAQVIAGFTHPEYGHMVTLPEAVRAALSQDFE